MTEAQEQAEVVKWFREKWPEHANSLRCSLNGLNLGGNKKAAILIKHAQNQGMVTGEADLAILLPKGGYGCLLIEHKRQDGSYKATPEQQEYIDYHTRIGNCAVITRGVDAMKGAITVYMEQ